MSKDLLVASKRLEVAAADEEQKRKELLRAIDITVEAQEALVCAVKV